MVGLVSGQREATTKSAVLVPKGGVQSPAACVSWWTAFCKSQSTHAVKRPADLI